MCLEIFLGSTKELPTIPWNEENPEFCVFFIPEVEQSDFIKGVLKSNYYYDFGSHMGCACGFCFGEWSEKQVSGDHQQRVKDITDLLAYLGTHLPGNTLKLFCTSWEDFPDVYPEILFSVSSPLPDEFYFEEDVVLLVTD